MIDAVTTTSAGESAMSAFDAAHRYARCGWSVIPIPHKSKNPGFPRWPDLRLTEADLPAHFNGKPQNIGVLLGEPSGWLIDIDLDHPRAVELAEQYLPPTPAIFGRPAKARSHWLYYTSGPVETKKHKSKSAGMIVELRSSGAQTVFPPSMHESGEPIEWEDESAIPATVDAEQLLAAVQSLAAAVMAELGERPPPNSQAAPNEPSPSPVNASLDPTQRVRNCVEAMLRMRMNDRNDGSGRLYAAACRTVEHDLSDDDAIAAIREYSTQRPFPRDWTDQEILQRVRDAEKECERGTALSPDPDSPNIPLGNHDPATGRIVLSPKKTLPTAEAFIREFYTHRNGRTLHSYAGLLLVWRQNRFVEIEDEGIKKALQEWLHGALRYYRNPKTGETEFVDFESNPMSVKHALDSIRSHAHLPASIMSPSWLDANPDRPPANEILPCRSQLVHLPTMKRIESTPAFFSTNALDFEHDPNAPIPETWMHFLHELFDDDLESQNLLQDWFGYSLTGDTSLQKMLLLVGPKRSGKGTIARVLKRLIGSGNVCGPRALATAGGEEGTSISTAKSPFAVSRADGAGATQRDET